MKLSKAEEQIMEYLWRLKKTTMKEIIEQHPSPPPAPTTVATLLKRMIDKGFVQYETIGKARHYYPMIEKSDYFSSHFRRLINNFFGDSAAQFASFFTRATDLTTDELKALRDEIDKELERKIKKR